MKKKCHSCRKELFDAFRYFGNYEEGKKIWCINCFKDLQEFIKKRWMEERIPQLDTEAKSLLDNCQNNERRFKDLTTNVRKFLTVLRRAKENSNLDIINDYTQQYELKKYLEVKK